jgi:hypothetical protein
VPLSENERGCGKLAGAAGDTPDMLMVREALGVHVCRLKVDPQFWSARQFES